MVAPPTLETQMATGTVKWFNPTKGYGFIEQEGGGPDIFVHYSSIDQRHGRKTLMEGEEVEYEIMESPKGPQATTVRKL